MSQRDQAAKRLLQDETFTDAFKSVQASLKDDLFNAPTPEEREEIYRQYQGLTAAISQLVQWAGQETIRRNQE